MKTIEVESPYFCPRRVIGKGGNMGHCEMEGTPLTACPSNSEFPKECALREGVVFRIAEAENDSA